MGPLTDPAVYVDEYFIRTGEGRLLDYVNHYQLGFTSELSYWWGRGGLTVWFNNQVCTYICVNVFYTQLYT